MPIASVLASSEADTRQHLQVYPTELAPASAADVTSYGMLV